MHMLSLVQISRSQERRIARVEGNSLLCLGGFTSIYEAASQSLRNGESFTKMLLDATVVETLPYDPIYLGQSEWRLLVPVDVPGASSRCLVSGTGLTHLGSAKDRQAM